MDLTDPDAPPERREPSHVRDTGSPPDANSTTASPASPRRLTALSHPDNQQSPSPSEHLLGAPSCETDVMTNTTESTSTIIIFTDGACPGNPGPGGWAFTKTFDGKTIPRRGHVCGQTTNNQMELVAVIQALRSLTRPDIPAAIYSDSKYVVNGVNLYLNGWVARDWRKSGDGQVLNVELWKALKRLLDARPPGSPVTFTWVEGHSGCAGNDEVDRLATAEAAKAKGRGSCAMPTAFDPDRGLVVPVFEVEES